MPQLGYSGVISQNSLAGTATLLQGGSLTITSIRAVNTTAANAYVQIFDAAAAGDVTVGTTIPVWVVKSEANDPSLGDGLPSGGLTLDLGLVAASTTTALGAVAASQHVRIGVT